MPSRTGSLMQTPPAFDSWGGQRWSVPIGRYGGSPVRLHASLAVLLVSFIAASAHYGLAAGWLAIAVYLFSLAAHESAHALAASALQGLAIGGKKPAILLGPLGGLVGPGPAGDPRDRVFLATAGPIANLVLVIVGMWGLSTCEWITPGELLLHPELALKPAGAGVTPLAVLSAVMIAVNWPLFLFNLAPAAPFDGGAALKAWLGVWLGRDTADEATRKIALILSAGLLSVGFTLAIVAVTSPIVPVTLAALAVVIAFGSRPGDPAETRLKPLGLRLEDTGGRSLSDLPPLMPLPADNGAPGDDLLEGELEQIEQRWDDAEVDLVLAKIHKRGVRELTANERAILERASQFYRRRRGEG